MADTTPIINAVNVDLANKLNDPVNNADNGVAVATDGSVFLAVQRNLALCDAMNQLAVRLIGNYGVDGAASKCEGLVATQSITFSSSGTSINKDYIAPLRLVGSATPEFLFRPKATLDLDLDIRIDRAYTIEGGLLYGYIRSAGTLTKQSSGTATFYYIKSDRKSTSTGAPVAYNTAPDTTIDQQWLIWVKEYASWWLAVNKGSGEWVAKAKNFETQMELKLPKV